MFTETERDYVLWGVVLHFFAHLCHLFKDTLKYGMLISDEKPVPSGQHPWRQPKITRLSETLESGYCLISVLLSAGFILSIVMKATQGYES